MSGIPLCVYNTASLSPHLFLKKYCSLHYELIHRPHTHLTTDTFTQFTFVIYLRETLLFSGHMLLCSATVYHFPFFFFLLPTIVQTRPEPSFRSNQNRAFSLWTKSGHQGQSVRVLRSWSKADKWIKVGSLVYGEKKYNRKESINQSQMGQDKELRKVKLQKEEQASGKRWV